MSISISTRTTTGKSKRTESDNWRLCEHGTVSEVLAVRDAQDDLAFVVAGLDLRTLRLVGGYVNLDSWQWFWIGVAVGWSAFGAIVVWVKASSQ